jgi:hypothetical protein
MAGESLTARFSLLSQLWFRWTEKCLETATSHMQTDIANRAFGCFRKFSAIYKHRQIVDLAFKMKKIKTKYNALAQCKLESLSLSAALLAIY